MLVGSCGHTGSAQAQAAQERNCKAAAAVCATDTGGSCPRGRPERTCSSHRPSSRSGLMVYTLSSRIAVYVPLGLSHMALLAHAPTSTTSQQHLHGDRRQRHFLKSTSCRTPGHAACVVRQSLLPPKSRWSCVSHSHEAQQTQAAAKPCIIVATRVMWRHQHSSAATAGTVLMLDPTRDASGHVFQCSASELSLNQMRCSHQTPTDAHDRPKHQGQRTVADGAPRSLRPPRARRRRRYNAPRPQAGTAA